MRFGIAFLVSIAFFGASAVAEEIAKSEEVLIQGHALYQQPGTYKWVRPKGVEWVFVRGIGGGGGGAGGGRGRPCLPGGGGGSGSGIFTQLVGPLTEETYEVVVGRGGNGGQAQTQAQPTIDTRGEAGKDSRFGNLVFSGAPGGELGRGGASDGAAGGSSAANQDGCAGNRTIWAAGGLGGKAIPHEDDGKIFSPAGGGGGGGASLGPGGNGGIGRGFKYNGESGTSGGTGAGGGGGGGACWVEGHHSSEGSHGGDGQVLIVWAPPRPHGSS